LPPIIGRQMNLSENQIAALTGQAPQLLDLNGNGVPDIQEAQAAPVQSGDVDIAAALALLAANPQLLSLVRPVDSMSNPTHYGPTQSPTQSPTQCPTQSGQGQGNGPAAKPLGPQGGSGAKDFH